MGGFTVVGMGDRLRSMRFTRQLTLLQIGVVAALVVVGFALVAWLLNHNLQRQYEQRALAVARTVASDPHLGDLVRTQSQPAVQEIATREVRATGALFVVVTDAQGIRLSHPDPNQIGKAVSTDPSEALSGREVARIEKGTLGLSARGKVPLRDSSGAIVGEVSVGFDARQIRLALFDALALAVPFAFGALIVGMAASVLLSRLLKRGTFGLEPAELADLVREREAVLYGVSDGVLAVDADGRVSMANDEAARLLGLSLPPGTRIADLDLPPRLRSLLDHNEERRALTVAGTRVLVANHRPVSRAGTDLGGVLTLRDRTDVEQLTSELDAVRSLTSALRAQRHEFANRMHTVIGLLQTNEQADALDYLRSVTQFTDANHTAHAEAIASATIRSFIAGKIARAGELGITLELSEQSWVPQKLIAPVEVVTVLGNLVDNALDAAHASTRRPARVEVDLLADGTQLVISVADSGDGVTPDQIEAIFAEGVSAKGPERGLGLAIARQTARSLGGDIVLTNPGTGGAETVFVATLPDVLDTSPGDDPDDEEAAS
jgi:two-component system CitB family sensor kinase